MSSQDYKAALERIRSKKKHVGDELTRLKQLAQSASGPELYLIKMKELGVEVEATMLDQAFHKVEKLEEVAEERESAGAGVALRKKVAASKEVHAFRKEPEHHKVINEAVHSLNIAYSFTSLNQAEKMLEDAKQLQDTKHVGPVVSNFESYSIGHKYCLRQQQGLAVDPDSLIAGCGAKAHLIDQDLELNHEKATPETVDKAVGRLNRQIEKYNSDKSHKPVEPIDPKKFGDRSAEEINQLSKWLKHHTKDFSSTDALRKAGMEHLQILDTKYKRADDPELAKMIASINDTIIPSTTLKPTQLPVQNAVAPAQIKPDSSATSVNPVALNKPTPAAGAFVTA